MKPLTEPTLEQTEKDLQLALEVNVDLSNRLRRIEKWWSNSGSIGQFPFETLQGL